VVAFDCGGGFSCLVNVSAEPVPLPAHGEVLIASGPLDDHRLPPDTAVWLRVD
jgi:alpha-glucosidase